MSRIVRVGARQICAGVRVLHSPGNTSGVRRRTHDSSSSRQRLVPHAAAPTATSNATVEPGPVLQGQEPLPPLPKGLPTTLVQLSPSAAPNGGGNSEVSPPPGVEDDRMFSQHWSVEFWRPRAYRKKEEMSDLRELVSVVAGAVSRANVLQDATTASYWAYHTARWAWFFLQSGSSLAVSAADNGERGMNQVSPTSGAFDRTAFSLLAWVRCPAAPSAPAVTPHHPVAVPAACHACLLAETSTAAVQNLSSEAFGAFECDLRNIKEGAYKLPWDMTTAGHRQSNPLFALRQSMLLLREAPQVLGRRRQPQGHVGVLPFEKSNLYPDYYQNNFHFQTDGWFSSRSADTYDIATESLFLGRQDAMQRGTLLALNRYFSASTGAGLDMLEVGAGTGRLATFVRDNYPAARLTVSDLSPFYLEKARSNMAYWERCASPSARSAGSAAFVQCAAEMLPQPDASMDVVYCVYMFHEIPDAARRAVLREFARVLKPGGVLIITDSMQDGDRPSTGNLRAFGEMNEPHYASYLEYSFGPALQAAGLRPDFKSLSSVSKTVTAVKP